MYTQCPECQTVFLLAAASLAQAHGHVACGHCHAHFDALTRLADQLPPKADAPWPTHAPSKTLPILQAGEELALPAPPFTPARRQRRDPWIAVCIMLLGLLGGQLAWLKHDTLIRNPITGGWLRSACARLGCHVPLVRDLHQLRLLSRDVQNHPSVAHALLINATIRNEADFTQPYPVFNVVLSDATGKKLAMRRFSPETYLDDQATLQQGIAPHSNVAIMLEVQDPGQRAVAFELSLQ